MNERWLTIFENLNESYNLRYFKLPIECGNEVS